MRRTILLGAAAAILVVIGIGVAVGLSRKPPQGKLETAPTGVTVISPSTSVATTAPKPRPAPSVDRRCWTQFGGGPARTLARPALDLGVPGKVGWAHGLSGYIEFPAVYCDGTLYVNTYRGDTWAIAASTGKTLWRRRSTAKKPSSPAIAGQNVIVSAKDGTVTALDRRNGHVAWRVLVGSAVESSPAVVGDLAYFGA
jgi:outer membrane protein assembly factor BamB